MPTFDAQLKAAELQRQLATLTGHDLAHVKPYGKHLLIQMAFSLKEPLDPMSADKRRWLDELAATQSIRE